MPASNFPPKSERGCAKCQPQQSRKVVAPGNRIMPWHSEPLRLILRTQPRSGTLPPFPFPYIRNPKHENPKPATEIANDIRSQTSQQLNMFRGLKPLSV